MTGRAAFEDGFYDVALKAFTADTLAAGTPTQHLTGKLWQARALLALQRAGEAQQVLEACQAETHGGELEGTWVYLSALALFEVGQPADAGVLLRDFEQRYPKNPEIVSALRLTANVLLKLNQPEQALALFAQIQRQYSRTPMAIENLWQWAEALRGLDRPDTACELLEQLTREWPNTLFADQARLRLAATYQQKQRLPEAEKTLKALAERVQARTDLRITAWNQLAQLYEAQTNLTAAVQALSQSAVMTTELGAKLRIDYSRGKLLFRLNRLDEGITVLRDVVRQSGTTPLAAEAQLELANQLQQHQRHDLALAEFQRYVEAFTETVGQRRALMGKGWCLWDLNRFDEAAGAFSQAANISSTPAEKAEAQCKVADAWFASQQYQQALPIYLALTNTANNAALAAQALYQAGLCHMCLSQPRAAEKLFSILAAAQPTNTANSARAGLGLALVCEDQGHWEQSVTAYDHVTLIASGTVWHAQALSGRGLLLYRMGKFPEALNTFTELMERFPSDRLAEQAFYMRGWCLYLMHNESEAVQIARQFIEKYPHSAWAPDVLFWLGEFAFNHGDHTGAERQFAELARNYPKSELADKALYWAGRAAAAASQHLKALDYYNQLVKAYPNSTKLAETRFAQGDALSELGKFAESILAFEEVLNKYPHSYLANLARGRRGDCAFTLANEDKSRYADALNDYRQVLDNPTADTDLKWQAEFKIGRCLEKQDKTAEALERYLAVVYSFLGERQKGRHGDPLWFTRAAFNAAEIQEKTGDWRKAVQLYQRVVEAGVPASQEALQRLQRIKLEHWMLF